MKIIICLLLAAMVLFTSCANNEPETVAPDEPFVTNSEPEPEAKPEHETAPEELEETDKPEELVPFIINLTENLDPADYAGRIPIKYGSGEDIVIIFTNTRMVYVNVSSVTNEDEKFYVDDSVFDLMYLTPDYYIEYSTSIPEGIPREAITFTISDLWSNPEGERSYVFAYNGLDGSTCVIEAEVVNKSVTDEFYTLDFFQNEWEQIELTEGVKPVVKVNETYDFIYDAYIEYDDGELVYIGNNWDIYTGSPDKTKIAFGGWTSRTGTDGAKIPISVFDIMTRKITVFNDFGLEGSTTPKRITWLNDEISLVIVGFDHGTVTRGGDLYYYNITDGTNGKSITPKQITDSGMWVELTFAEVQGDNIKFNVSVAFDGVNNWFNYTDNIPLNQVHELINKGETYEYSSIIIEST